jgi:hypothetical protein
LRYIADSGIKVSSLGVSRGERIDHILVLPGHDAASGLGVSDCLLPIAKERRLEARILPERFIAVLNGEFVFALPSKNLRAIIERWPQSRINPKRRIYVSLCPCNIALSQLIACVTT